jgi:hypothetical protein
MTFVTPLVLDLDGNGVRTLGLEAGVQFDLAASGSKRTTGWVGSGDGLLALDRNGDGAINDGSELFGSATRLADGSTAADGYAALAALDDNGDGKIDAKDCCTRLAGVDRCGCGRRQPAGRVEELAELRIASLNLDAAQRCGRPWQPDRPDLDLHHRRRPVARGGGRLVCAGPGSSAGQLASALQQYSAGAPSAAPPTPSTTACASKPARLHPARRGAPR